MKSCQLDNRDRGKEDKTYEGRNAIAKRYVACAVLVVPLNFMPDLLYLFVFPVCSRILCISLLLGLKCISFALRCMLPLGKSVCLLTSALICLYNMVYMWKKRNNIVPV